MLKSIKYLVAVIAFIMSSQVLAGEVKLNNNLVYEIVKWKSKSNVKDQDMIDAVNNMVTDLKSLKGFLHQSLYKNSNEEWVDIYYWETEEDAHASNESMATKNSFDNLIKLIEPNTVSVEILHPLQSSGEQSFDK